VEKLMHISAFFGNTQLYNSGKYNKGNAGGITRLLIIMCDYGVLLEYFMIFAPFIAI
jgi:hypothetical protein